MRRSQVCPKCNHNEIVYSANVAETGVTERDVRAVHAAVIPMPDGTYTFAGRLTATICRKCGYTELYAKEPDRIPVDGAYVTQMDGPDKVGPFR